MLAVLTIESADHSWCSTAGVTEILLCIVKSPDQRKWLGTSLWRQSVSMAVQDQKWRLNMSKLRQEPHLWNGVGINTLSLYFLYYNIKILPTLVELAVSVKECYNTLGKLKWILDSNQKIHKRVSVQSLLKLGAYESPLHSQISSPHL